MILVLPERLRNELSVYAKASQPRECCGFLLGQDINGMLQVSDVWPVQNNAMTEDRYAMTSESVLMAVMGAGDRKLDVLAAYHSHPNGQAIPSEIDRQAAIPGMLHVILGGTEQSKPRAWRLSKDNVFEPVTLATSCP